MSLRNHTDRWSKQEADSPFNLATAVTIAGQEKATVTVEPSDRESLFFAPVIAISDYGQTTYSVKVDGNPRYQAAIPPTDITMVSDAFRPPVQFKESVEITISNLAPATDPQTTYNVRILGWQRRRKTGERDNVGWKD